MPWVKIDDKFDEHPKAMQVGPEGVAIFIAGLCYCNRNLTDGFIPEARARTLLWSQRRQHRDKILARMCQSGLWVQVANGYQIHDYDQYQPSKAEVIEKREQTRNRVKNFRASRAGGNGHVTSLLPESNAGVTLPPVPVPVPNLELQTTLSGKPDTNPTKRQKKEPCQDCAKVIAHLNERTGRNYRNMGATATVVHRRHTAFSADACLDVIDWLWVAWKDDDRMRPYLRPDTIFNGKFASRYEAICAGEKPPKMADTMTGGR